MSRDDALYSLPKKSSAIVFDLEYISPSPVLNQFSFTKNSLQISLIKVSRNSDLPLSRLFIVSPLTPILHQKPPSIILPYSVVACFLLNKWEIVSSFA